MCPASADLFSPLDREAAIKIEADGVANSVMMKKARLQALKRPGFGARPFPGFC
jgi:hypothetical protein